MSFGLHVPTFPYLFTNVKFAFFQNHLFREASYIYATQCEALCIEGKEPERSVSKPKEYNNESTKKSQCT